MLRNYALLATLVLGSLLGCKKDSTPPSNTDLLTNKNWVVTAATVSPGIPAANGAVITDLYAQEAACSKDDITIFQTPNVLKEDEGATKCNANDPQTTSGTWAFNTDQTILTTTDSSGTISYTIKSLDSSNMVLTTTQTTGTGTSAVTYTFTFTFHHS